MEDERQELGAAGERIAERFLRRKGYVILERNFRCPTGEIDLVALDGKTVVFVEVKTRTQSALGTPFEAIDTHKQRQLRRAAQYYLVRHRLTERFARFDVVGVLWESDPPHCELLRDAF